MEEHKYIEFEVVVVQSERDEELKHKEWSVVMLQPEPEEEQEYIECALVVHLHNMFIDYTRAFDSIKRNKVSECLNQYNIPTNYKSS